MASTVTTIWPSPASERKPRRLAADRVVPRHGAHLEVVRALRHQQVDQSLALQLQRERAVELERGGQQHHRAHRLAQQLLHGGWIVLVFAQIEPGARQAHGVTADGMPFEDEATDEIGLGHSGLSRLASSSEAR